MTQWKDWSIVCDFDGTITPFDVTDAVLDRFARPEWEAIEQEWKQGNITAHECMERQIALIDVSLPHLDAFLDVIPLTEGFREFVTFCKEEGIVLRVISDGMDYAIRRILSRHGLGDLPVVANRLVPQDGHAYRLEFPYGVQGCPSGVCKCSVAKAQQEPVLLIGDGRSDCCVAKTAFLVLAKEGEELEKECQKYGYPYRTYINFFDVRARIEDIIQSCGKKACGVVS